MTIKSILFNILQYSILLIVLIVAAMVFQRTADVFYRFIIISGVALFYILWGFWHHYHHDRLHKHVILEYSLVAFIVIMLAALGLGVIRFF